MLAKAYFDGIDFASAPAEEFIIQQYKQYASAVEDHAEENKILMQQAAAEESINNILLSTTSLLDGYRVEKYIDIIYSEVIYKLSLGKAFSTMLSDAMDNLNFFTTKELSGTTRLIQDAKDYVKRDLKMKAASLGANAVIGIDIESSVSTDGTAKVSINGTAVVIADL